jgi:hypothetical protein
MLVASWQAGPGDDSRITSQLRGRDACLEHVLRRQLTDIHPKDEVRGERGASEPDFPPQLLTRLSPSAWLAVHSHRQAKLSMAMVSLGL